MLPQSELRPTLPSTWGEHRRLGEGVKTDFCLLLRCSLWYRSFIGGMHYEFLECLAQFYSADSPFDVSQCEHTCALKCEHTCALKCEACKVCVVLALWLMF